MIDWKKPTKDVQNILREQFLDLSLSHVFVWATEDEVALSMGYDLTNLTEDQKREGPLVDEWYYGRGDHVREHLMPHANDDELESLITIPWDLPDGTPVVIAEKWMLDSK